jgi:O-antigen/teichoic acid export membrane protein
MDLNKPTWTLVSGRSLGMMVAFAIPIVLVRFLDQTEYGTYRELFVIYGSLMMLAPFGMAESLYYFVPREPREAGRYAANTVATLVGVSLVCAVGGLLVAPAAARYFGNQALGDLMPYLVVFLALMLTSVALEMVMIARKRYALAAGTYAGLDIVKAAALITPGAVLGSVEGVLLGAIGFAVVRLALVVRFLWREFGRDLRLDFPRWKEQLAYALPFGAAVIVEVAQVNYHQYAVMRWFDTTTFAIYAVGCLQIPVIDLLVASAANVMMVAMAEHRDEPAVLLSVWQGTIARLALVFVPTVVLLQIVGADLIVMLFTAQYAASVPIFLVSTSFILLAALPVDGALRAFAATRFLFVMNLIRLTVVAVTIAWFVSTFHLVGAVLVTVAATGLAKLLAVHRIARLLGVPAWRALPWRSLAITAGASLIAAVPAYLVGATMTVPMIVKLAAVGSTYVLVYVGLLAAGRMLRVPRVLNLNPEP